MKGRGRPSAVSLSLTAVEPGRQRPEPPADLDERAAAEWRAIVNSMRADWFPRETHPMLALLCRQVSYAEEIARRTRPDAPDYKELLKVSIQLAESIMKLSTKMRISQQSSYDKGHSKKAAGAEAPTLWRDAG